MSSNGLIRASSVAIAVIALTIGAAQAAENDEASRIEDAKSILESLKGAHDKHEMAIATAQLRNLVQVHNQLEAESWRSKLQEQACRMVRDRDWAEVRTQAVRALAEIDAPKAAWKHLRKAMPGHKVEKVDAAGLAVLGAVGKLAQDGAIAPLVDLMRKAKDAAASKGAILALGGYGRSKRRVLVLKELLDLLKKSRPSRAPGKRIGRETRNRWNAIRGPLVASLNRLTGKTETSVEVWLDLYGQHKKSLRGLFQHRR